MRTIEAQEVRGVSRELVRLLGFMEEDCLNTRLTHSEFHCLLEVLQKDVATPKDLGERLRLDKSKISRTVKSLETKGYLHQVLTDGDGRKKRLALTKQGLREFDKVDTKAQMFVESALSFLESETIEKLKTSLDRYNWALSRAQKLREFSVEPIRQEHNSSMRQLIWQVLSTFDATGPGFACHDEEMKDLFEAYQKPGWRYFVVLKHGLLKGGAGIGQLAGANPEICELKKMYFSTDLRGLGMGKYLLKFLLREAIFKANY